MVEWIRGKYVALVGELGERGGAAGPRPKPCRWDGAESRRWPKRRESLIERYATGFEKSTREASLSRGDNDGRAADA